MLSQTFGTSEPRQYQVDSIFHLAYRKIDLMYLIRKTGEGKSLVLQGLAAARRGITVVLGPLHGLGTDQATKTKRIDKGIEGWHLD